MATNKVTAQATHLEEVQVDLGATRYATVTANAQIHQDAEHTMSLIQAIRRYPKAIMWSVILSCAIIMEGFDLTLLSSLYAQPQFQRKYGVLLADGSYTIESRWQIGLNLANQAGSIIGLLGNGWAAERFGYRVTILSALSMMSAVIFLPFFAQNIETLFVGQLLAGVPWGVFQTLTTAYASEVVPIILRPYLTAYVNLCWVFGQLIAAGTLRGVLEWNTEWSYRLPFALQWIWPPLIILPCLFAPDSPWWLVRKRRMDDARSTLRQHPRRATNAYQNAFKSIKTTLYHHFKGNHRSHRAVAPSATVPSPGAELIASD
ncbi:hypothetical protein DB88DRAFT_458828 [Papiliotrema laurentii]|uniref:Major facilitator superfamily (MFS) profile domain-containing protein n=1 Tax=Papiliotrema laurentii TaxID=5418 RepID=A0AAD9CR47_PAPLA|nr:hypothetical protein DB88DRAFT_458828 [Papiliotrema laurentii]